jgi:Mg-chelatase subunit ChlD
MFNRPWAFWRRTQYVAIFSVFLLLLGSGAYFGFFYEPANCFDGRKNGEERGVDCGGKCARVCALDVRAPTVLWSRAFRVTDGQYNAVAYIENTNQNVGSPEVRYTFELYDRDGLITTKSGTTVLPPDSVYPIFEGRINTGDRIPTQAQIVLEDPELWLPATAGREQFVVEGRELVNADSGPRLNAQITNTALTEAKNVEIVATIFDTRGNALTASRTIVPIFGSRTTENVVFTWPEPIAKTVRSCEVPTDVVLAIDLSGSMNDDGGNPPEPITSVLHAAEAFIDRLNPKDQAGIVTYASTAATPQSLTNVRATVREVVGGLTISPQAETGSTNTGDALIAANTEINSARHNPDARKVVVLLTDGLATSGGQNPEKHARDAAAALKATNTELFTIGLGGNVHEAFLKEIASGEKYYFRAATAETVDQIYRSVTDAICEDGAAVIEIIPKTGTNFASPQ